MQKVGQRDAILERVQFDRRSKVRFPLKLRVNFKAMSRRFPSAGVGWVVNISSSGVLVEYPHKVRTGARLELKIELPLRLDGLIPLQLVAMGRVVRCEESRFAVAVARCHYRTMGGWTQRSLQQE